jgi:hypothetical protein
LDPGSGSATMHRTPIKVISVDTLDIKKSAEDIDLLKNEGALRAKYVKS